jgi:ABC-type transporter Mla subunit MlaD
VKDRIDDAALVTALDRARSLLEQVAGTLESASGAAARGQSQLETIGDAARGSSGRGRDVRTSLQPLYEALERAKLGALNAGLEAARIGDPLSKVVMQLASDSRELVLRALEALEAHATLLAETEREQERWLDGVAQARAAFGALNAELTSLQRQRQEMQGALLGLEQELAPALGIDPATARLLVAVSAQSAALARAIGELSARGGPETAGRLREALVPVLDVLGPPPEREKP